MLELKVMELDRRLTTATLVTNSGNDEDDDSEVTAQPIGKRRGRPPRIEQEELLHIRDLLIQFLESNWPNLELIFEHGARLKPDGRIAWFEKAIYAVGRPSAIPDSLSAFAREHLVKPKVVNALCEFIKDSKRYHGDPRSIASALAGVDKLHWRTSLDRCEKQPYRVTMLAPAVPAYLRRTYKTLYPQLSGWPLSKKTMRTLRASKDDYLWLFQQGDNNGIELLLNRGRPDYKLLQSLGIQESHINIID